MESTPSFVACSVRPPKSRLFAHRCPWRGGAPATDPADRDFRRLVVEEERRRGAELPIDSLIALAAVREFKRVTAEELAGRIQRDASSAKRTLEAPTEAGLVEAHGTTRGRSYTLSAAVYRVAGDKAGYTRQAGFAPIQQEQMVLSYVRQHGQIKRAEVMELCRLSSDQASSLLKLNETAWPFATKWRTPLGDLYVRPGMAMGFYGFSMRFYGFHRYEMSQKKTHGQGRRNAYPDTL